MMKTEKNYRLVFAFLLFALLVSFQTIGIAAEENYVFDEAGLLTDTEEQELNRAVLDCEAAAEWNIFLVTVSDALGKTSAAYADDFFEEHSPEKEDGVALLIDMDNREIYISTGGMAIRFLTDERIERILDDAFKFVADESYAQCLEEMLNGINSYYDTGISEGQYNYDIETGNISVYRSLTTGEVLIAVLVAAGAGAIVFLSIVGRYRLKFGTYRYNFRNNCKMNVRRKQDVLINNILKHRHIPKPESSEGNSTRSTSTRTRTRTNSSPGRSSTHTSSSGRSHRGGGRSF